jgi:hypothetical protein
MSYRLQTLSATQRRFVRLFRENSHTIPCILFPDQVAGVDPHLAHSHPIREKPVEHGCNSTCIMQYKLTRDTRLDKVFGAVDLRSNDW